jgi:transcription initiation factor IIE alpha subunit
MKINDEEIHPVVQTLLRVKDAKIIELKKEIEELTGTINKQAIVIDRLERQKFKPQIRELVQRLEEAQEILREIR